jgi:hypothetical protein
VTTLYPEEVTCVLCGAQSEHMSVASTSTFGAPDLDLRPPPLARENLSYQVQRCPGCGYCAGDLSHDKGDAGPVVASQGYRDQLGDPSLPELACSFLCAASVEEALGNYPAASIAALRAAWACDDASDTDGAVKCRSRVLALFDLTRARKQAFADDPATEDCLFVDVLRRVGEFQRAGAICRRASQSRQPVETVGRILAYEQTLIDRGDVACHTVEEAFDTDAA